MAVASTTDVVRLAVIGAGLIGTRHAHMIAGEPTCRLIGIADPSPRAAALASDLGVRHRGSHEQLLDSSRVDGAIVAAPTEAHVAAALDCVSRGIPVLVEKPIADSVDAGQALVAAADAAGVSVAVGHHRRFAPAVAAAKEILRGGTIGRLIAVSGIWALRKPDRYFSEAPWRWLPGGGPLLINLIHDVDLLRYCCGEVERVYAETSTSERSAGVEESGVVTLCFASGALASIAFSDATPSPWNWESGAGDTPFVPATRENCYRFLGSAGSFEFPRLAIWRHAPGREASWTEAIHREARDIPVGDALGDQLRHFVRVVRGETDPLCSAGDALASLAVVEAARESARAGNTIRPSYPAMA